MQFIICVLSSLHHLHSHARSCTILSVYMLFDLKYRKKTLFMEVSVTIHTYFTFLFHTLLSTPTILFPNVNPFSLPLIYCSFQFQSYLYSFLTMFFYDWMLHSDGIIYFQYLLIPIQTVQWWPSWSFACTTTQFYFILPYSQYAVVNCFSVSSLETTYSNYFHLEYSNTVW